MTEKRPELLPTMRVLMVTPTRSARAGVFEDILHALDSHGALGSDLLYEDETPPHAIARAIDAADVVFLFRPNARDAPGVLRQARQSGKLTVWATDDDLLAAACSSRSGSSGPITSPVFDTLCREVDLVWLFADETPPPAVPNAAVVVSPLPAADNLRGMQFRLLREISLLALRKQYRGWQRPRLLVVGYDRSSSLHIHALQPCRQLEQEGWLEFIWRQPDEIVPRDLTAIDAVFVVRAFEPNVLKVLGWARRRGLPVVSSWDDDFFSIPAGTPLGDFYRHPEVVSAMRRFLSESDLVVTSTPPLSARSRELSAHVMECSYGLDVTTFDAIRAPTPRSPHSDGKVRVGFYGVNAGIAESWIVEAVQRVRARYGSRMVFELIGCRPPPELRRMTDWFSEGLLPYEQSLEVLYRRGWDIGLAPLADTPFNAAKQATKFRDYAWCGAAIVCSRVPTYERELIDGVHCRFAENTAAAWEAAIASLIDDPKLAESLRTRATQLLYAAHTQAVTNAGWYQLTWRLGAGSARAPRASSAAARRTPDAVVSECESMLARYERAALRLTDELDSLRQRRIIRWSARLRPPRDLSGSLAPALQPLKADSARIAGDLHGFILRPSANLQRVAGLSYSLEPRCSNLCGVLLALVLDFPTSDGELGVAVMSAAGGTMAQSLVPLSEVSEQVPTLIRFPSIANSDGGRFELRVFVRDAPYPVRLLEWRKYRLAGLGRLERRAFCRLVFDAENPQLAHR